MRPVLGLALLVASTTAHAGGLALTASQPAGGATAPTTLAAPLPEPRPEPLAHALAARQRGELSVAIAQLQTLLADDPTQRNVAFELATTFAWNHQLSDALRLFIRLSDGDPADLSAAVAVARIQGWQEHFDQARARLHQVLHVAPNHIEALLALGMMELAALHRDSAEQAFTRVLQIDRTNPEAQRGLQNGATATRIGIRMIVEYRAGQDIYSVLGMANYRITPRATVLLEGGQVSPIAADPATQPAVEWRVAAGMSYRGKKLGGAMLIEALPDRHAGGVLASVETARGRVHVGAMARLRHDGDVSSILTNVWTLVDLPKAYAVGASVYGSQELDQRRISLRGRVVLPPIVGAVSQLIAERRGDGEFGIGLVADAIFRSQRQVGVSLMVWPSISQAWLGMTFGLRL